MAKRKRYVEKHIDESWLIPYADMLTLLLALFIVLFAASNVDEEKFSKVSAAFEDVFGIEDPTGIGPGIENPPLPQETKTPPTEPIKTNIVYKDKDLEQLKALKRKIDEYIAQNGLEGNLKTNLTDGGLLITFPEVMLFSPGSASLPVESQQLAQDISKFLVTDPPRDIRIGGHTDNVPIHTKEFPSNWELSSARALNFMKVLLENSKLDPYRFSATGYGEYRPVDSNETAEGRAKNRRVEVLILPLELKDLSQLTN